MERQFEKILLKYGWEKVSNWECDIEMAGKKQNSNPMWKVFNINCQQIRYC